MASNPIPILAGDTLTNVGGCGRPRRALARRPDTYLPRPAAIAPMERPALPASAIPAPTIIAVTTMAVTIASVKTKAARYAGTGRVADHTASDEAGRAEEEGARGRAKRAVEQPLAGTRRCRYQCK